MFLGPDFILIPNKNCIYVDEFCFKFTLDVIQRIPKFEEEFLFFLKYFWNFSLANSKVYSGRHSCSDGK